MDEGRVTRLPWARVIAEGAAIVVSILLAFAIQAWWEELGEDRAARVYLTQLRTDLNRAEAQLADSARLEEAAGLYQEGVPTLSTALGLIGSDGLQSLESAEIRDGLINLLDELRQMEQRQLLHEEIFMQGLFRLNRIVPALSRGMARYVGLLPNPPDSLTRTTRVEGEVSVDLRPLLRDPDFLAAVDELWISHENLRSYIQGMLNETRAFLELLDRALE